MLAVTCKHVTDSWDHASSTFEIGTCMSASSRRMSCRSTVTASMCERFIPWCDPSSPAGCSLHACCLQRNSAGATYGNVHSHPVFPCRYRWRTSCTLPSRSWYAYDLDTLATCTFSPRASSPSLIELGDALPAMEKAVTAGGASCQQGSLQLLS
jgi:hypothetical protein